jgi:hypothetical protein
MDESRAFDQPKNTTLPLDTDGSHCLLPHGEAGCGNTLKRQGIQTRRGTYLSKGGRRAMAAKKQISIPHPFVLEELQDLSPLTKPMFGCLAVYVNGLIVLILRDRESSPEDNGVWLATTDEHHASLKKEFPSMRSISLFGKDVTGWQVLPLDAEDFEESALKACELVRQGDPRIGKIPQTKKRKAKPSPRSATKKAAKKASKKAAKKKTKVW